MAAQDLVVLSGFHAGALIEARSGTFQIGTNEDSDVILIDLPGEGDTASLRWSDEHQAYQIDALAAGISIDKRAVQIGEQAFLSRGQILTLSEAKIGFGQDVVSGRKIEAGYRRSRSLRLFGLVTAGLLITGGLGNMAMGLLASDGAANAPRGTRAPTVISGEAQQQTATVLQSLRARVSEAGLSSAISVDPEPGSDVIRAVGRIRASQSQPWQQIVRWFDGTHGATTLLENDVTLAAGSIILPFDVRSIATQPQPRLTIHDGRSYQAGDVLPGGWRVLDIEAGEIQIARAGEILRLEF